LPRYCIFWLALPTASEGKTVDAGADLG
jgi:hypothetical protein